MKPVSIAFPAITTLFFLWGFTTVNNDVLIPWYEKTFHLNDTESMLVNLAFFGSYGFWSLVYFLYSVFKEDPINKLGYKNGILAGLIISAAACFLFYPITWSGSYALCLLPLFLLGMGFTLLQISCNPFVAILGPAESSSRRLNLSQGFNSLGTTIAPMVFGYLIFTYFQGTAAVQIPYLILGCAFTIWAVIIWKIPLPDFRQTAVPVNKSALRFRHLKLGMLAIFFYVGAEVAIGSKLIEYLELPAIGAMDRTSAACFVGLYWGGAMIGRLSVSVISNLNLSLSRAIFYGILTSLTCFLFLLISMTTVVGLKARGFAVSGQEIYEMFHQIKPILAFIALQFLLMVLLRKSAKKLLSAFAIVAMVMLFLAWKFEGTTAIWCIVALGLFHSIMWSNIFTLSIEDLKECTGQGSALLIIMICGGAVLPMAVGWISDHFSPTVAFLLPIISYIYIAFFGAFGTLRQGK